MTITFFTLLMGFSKIQPNNYVKWTVNLLNFYINVPNSSNTVFFLFPIPK